jgi:Fe-S-cluster-containing dehydrogenase component
MPAPPPPRNRGNLPSHRPERRGRHARRGGLCQGHRAVHRVGARHSRRRVSPEALQGTLARRSGEIILRRLEKETKEQYGADVTIADYAPEPGVKFGYALNLSVCNGCRKCAEACHIENNHDRPSHSELHPCFRDVRRARWTWKGQRALRSSRAAAGQVLHAGAMPAMRAPALRDVCPVEATWKEADGIVVVDYNWCIGCRYCEAACPYHARRFNWTKPQIPAERNQRPNQSYLSNRIRPQGVMEKCHFCLHRTRKAVCPPASKPARPARGSSATCSIPDSEIRQVLAHKRVFVLKEELGPSRASSISSTNN